MEPSDPPSPAPDGFEGRFEGPRFWFSTHVVGSVVAAGLLVFAHSFYRIVEGGLFDRVVGFVLKHPAFGIGLPASMACALVVVLLMRNVAGPTEVAAFGVKSKGASGRIVMRVPCFGALAAGMKLLWTSG
jgi:hypothetical protein